MDIGAAQESGLVREFRLKIALEHQIVLERIIEHQTVLVPVLGDVAHAHHAALPDGSVGNILAAQANLSAHHRLQTGQAVDQLRLAVAVDAGDADDLAAPDVERNAAHGVILVDLGGDDHVLDLKHGLARLHVLFLDLEVNLAANHHGRKLFERRVSRVDRADAAALSQDGAAVGDRHDLRQLVGDKQDRFALRRQIAHDLHQLVDLLRRQNGRRLVEDQDLIVAVEHLEDLRSLLHTDGNILDQRVGIDVQTVLLAQRNDLFPRLLLLEEAHLVRLNAENDIVQNSEALDQLEVLVHHTDVQVVGIVGVVDLYDLPIFLDYARLRLIQTEQNAHQRRFARTVLAQQRMNLAAPELQSNIVIGPDAWEFLGNVQHLNDILRFRQVHHSFDPPQRAAIFNIIT